MSLWLQIALVLLLQETATTNFVLFAAHKAQYSVWLIHLIFVATAWIDLTFAYRFGKRLQRQHAERWLVQRLERWVGRFERSFGPFWIRAFLVVFGFFNFSYVNAFLASWLKLSEREALSYLFAGLSLWYVTQWGIVLGLRAVGARLPLELGVIIAFAAAVTVLAHFLYYSVSDRVKRRQSERSR